MKFSFEKGSDLLIKVDGEILGGVIRLRRAVKNNPDAVYEFLNEKPVALIPRKTYVLRFYMRCENGCVFDGDFNSIEVCGRGKSETYTMCTATRCESRAYPNTDINYTVTVTARERSVAYE